jgi:hypothetical protein
MPIVASRMLSQLEQKAALADTCLARNERNAAASLPRGCERFQKSCKLALAANEWRRFCPHTWTTQRTLPLQTTAELLVGGRLMSTGFAARPGPGFAE